MRFMGCAHATQLDLLRLNGRGPTPNADTDDAALLQKYGDAHEAQTLSDLKAEGRRVVEIEREDLASAANRTAQALAAGPDVVYQGALLSGQWGGFSDFLLRVDRPSILGNFSYEVTDTKLKRKPHPSHVLQLVLYSDLLEQVQGVAPEFAHVKLGNGATASLRLSDYSAYARAARTRLQSFVNTPGPTRSVPCASCALCRWADHCTATWQAEDSLFNVANISRQQVKRLEAAGIKTMAGLASTSGAIAGMADGTSTRLSTQAKLQHARKTGKPAYVLRPKQHGKGFDLLPEPQPGDLFYDIEGDPHFEGGLEYLHGVWDEDRGFRALWAHDHEAEAQALTDLLELFRSQLQAFPTARIYHYAPYEITALRRLTAKYGIGETFLDRLLRERRFVDLYAVVRGGVLGSEDNYSIKSMEAFYGLTRDGEVKTAGGSVVAYEAWRESSDQNILDEIEDYNRIDCVSTQLLRDWLVDIRPEGPWPTLGDDAMAKQVLEDTAAAALRQQLDASQLSDDKKNILFNLGRFHYREAKPAWWAVFDSLSRDDGDLVDDLDALAGLEATEPAYQVKRSWARSYCYPPQQTKLRVGGSPTVATLDGPATVHIQEMDREARRITIRSSDLTLLLDQMALHPPKPLATTVLADAVLDVVADQCGSRRYQAVDDLLNRSPPQLADAPVQDVLFGDADPVFGTIAAVKRMRSTVLPIQGPPGSGKTYTTARAILALVKDGRRVGVASSSHEAIRNVLLECQRSWADAGLSAAPAMVHKVGRDEEDTTGGPDLPTTQSNDDPDLGTAQIVGGTAFFFARDQNVQGFDWLFVDEAGQVSLANAVAMGRAATNIVLVGDPQQLPQVIQGAHPYPANLSCLEWLLGDHATVPKELGVFLPVSRRMHPDVCRFISDRFYDGRLDSHPDTRRQSVSVEGIPATGVFWVPTEHRGSAQVSEEEVAAITHTVGRLLAGRWTDRWGATKPLSESDIIVVAPYNAQVNALRAALPDGVRVGTVDKFQGKEAAVCLVSMTASSIEEIPRGMEFLMSPNRINVAVSRAKALALIFGSQQLREASCSTIEQMRLVNTLCAAPQLS
jgi:uncharacterized protein